MNITLQIEFNGESLRVDTDHAVDLSIPLEFGGPQPNHFDAPAATASPLESGTFVGDTREGGSCNCETLSLVPHCNGTHTECVGHVTDDRVAVNSIAPAELLPAALITVEPIRCEDTRESTAPRPEPKDHVITRSALSASLGQAPGDPPEALIVRTKPNREEKRTRRYAESKTVPYFTAEAMEWLVKKNVRHLIVDTPSVDRLHDGGALTSHRIFWGLPPASREASKATRVFATITELAFVPDNVPDGIYLLNLQVAPFVCDAAPSRPILYPIVEK